MPERGGNARKPGAQLSAQAKQGYTQTSPEGPVGDGDGRSQQLELEDVLSHHSYPSDPAAGRPGSKQPTSSAPALPIAGEALEPLLQQLADLVAAALAPRLAAELARQATPAAPAPTRRLLSLDELVAQLPAAKSAQTWKRWLYERTRKDQVPGRHKLGGRLFFDPEQTIPWLTGSTDSRLDLPADPSLHQQAMPDQPPSRRPGRGR
jgi:hypothetical protein